jgi:hydroxymethylpyrimidine/phosphomethylpyrimidine kinase
MNYNRPIVISIAGFDPSGGAGVLADVKTFEQHNCLGMGVVSALTVQTENQFISVDWLSAEKIIEQLKPLMENYNCSVVKIGIIENLDTLSKVVSFLCAQNNNIKIVWDTVLAASSGFNLMPTINQIELKELLKHLYLITPNTNEAIKLTNNTNELDAAKLISNYCYVLLKGGHSILQKGIDQLYYEDQIIEFKPSDEIFYAKHGSGCILSSAIAANIALGQDLETACKKAKAYIEKILNSNPQLLAYHVQ